MNLCNDILGVFTNIQNLGVSDANTMPKGICITHNSYTSNIPGLGMMCLASLQDGTGYYCTQFIISLSPVRFFVRCKLETWGDWKEL